MRNNILAVRDWEVSGLIRHAEQYVISTFRHQEILDFHSIIIVNLSRATRRIMEDEDKRRTRKSSESIVTASRLFVEGQNVMKSPNELARSQFPTLPLAPLTGCTRSRCIESLKTTGESLKLMMACSPRLYRCWGANKSRSMWDITSFQERTRCVVR